MQTIINHLGQIETAVLLIFGLVGLNYARDGKKMTPPLRKQLEIAAITSVSLIIGVWGADVNGLGNLIDGAMKLFLGLYLVATLLVLGQLNPVIKPLIDKIINLIEKEKE